MNGLADCLFSCTRAASHDALPNITPAKGILKARPVEYFIQAGESFKVGIL